MNVIETGLKDCYIIEPKVFGDHRGYFMETYNEKTLKENNLKYHFVQGNESFTEKKGTFRGLHFQKDPHSQAKLVRATSGEAMVIIVDLRKDSPTYKGVKKVVVTAENKRQVIVPRGFAHGFLTLTDNVTYSYQVDNAYNYEADSGINVNSEELDLGFDFENLILSEKDINSQSLKDYDENYYGFTMGSVYPVSTACYVRARK